VIRGRYPDFAPCAYLNGTAQPDSFKWLLAMRVGNRRRIHGWVGPKFLETTQSAYHLFVGRYLSYAPPRWLSVGRSVLLSAWPWDAGVRAAARSLARHPTDIFRKQHLQSILMIQPIDLCEDGRDNMCDGCPDMTVHDGKLVWSCRLEEPRRFGTFVNAVPKATPRPAERHLPVIAP
jgi:hypothetical protein